MMLDKLFNSGTRVKVLDIFLSTDNARYYVQELARLIETDVASVHRELNTLEEIKVLQSEFQGKQKYFELNKNLPLLKGLKVLFKEYKDNFENEWVLEADAISSYPLSIIHSTNFKDVNEFFEKVGLDFRLNNSLIYFKNFHYYSWLKNNDFKNMSRSIENKILTDPEWAKHWSSKAIESTTEFYKYSENVWSKNFSAMSELELAIELENFYAKFAEADSYHWLQTALDFGDNQVLKVLLKRLLEKTNNAVEAKSSIAILTTPFELTYSQKEYFNLLEILNYIQSQPKTKEYFTKLETRILISQLWQFDSKLDNLIEQHTFNYGWLGYGRMGPSWSKEYYVEILKNLVNVNNSATDLIGSIRSRVLELENSQKDLVEKYQLEPDLVAIFEGYRQVILAKIHRKEKLYYGYWVCEFLFQEIAQRQNLTLDQIRAILPNDIERLKTGEKFTKDELNAKVSDTLCLFLEGKKDEFWYGEEAQKYLSQKAINFDASHLPKNLHGVCVLAGRVKGVARILKSSKDLGGLPNSTIIVVNKYFPEIELIVEKITGVLVPENSLNNQDIVLFARKHGLPCITELKNADKLKNDQLVDVDATHAKAIIIL